MGVRNRFAAAAAAYLILLVLCCTNASASAACPTDVAQPSMATAGDAAFALLCDMNELRAQNGVGPLRWDWRLWIAAQRHAQDMAAQHYFSHRGLDGRDLQARVQATGYIPINPDWLIGENLGFGTSYKSSPLAVAMGWMNSDAHRENLLEPTFKDVGIGVVEGVIDDFGPVGMIYVANFGQRTDDTVSPRARAHRARRR
jgi:uncharacterized protein YkwD